MLKKYHDNLYGEGYDDKYDGQEEDCDDNVNLTFKTEVMMSKQYSAGARSSLAGSLQQNVIVIIITIIFISITNK